MQISDADLGRLVRDQRGLCVSLYAPTHRAGRGRLEDPIRLRNMIRSAENKLRRAGLRVPAIREVIQPAREMIRRPGFWRHPDSGVALFLSPDTHLHYHLPVEPPRTLLISRRFYLKPILSVLSEDESFFLLTLSGNAVTAYWGNRSGIVAADTPDLPRSPRRPADAHPRSLQWHTRTGDRRGGKRAAVFHGQEDADTVRKDELLHFFRRVDRALGRLLGDRNLPMVVIGADRLLPIYRKANTYPRLAAALPAANPERLETGELGRLAWRAVQPILNARREKAVRSFRRLAAGGNPRASTDIAAILPAAFQGKVQTLFVDARARAWGIFDPEIRFLRDRPPDDEWAEDLFDLAAVQVRMHGGDVFVSPPGRMPAKASIAAQLGR
jgi:hypothetical protein